jgi:hypothetical protein
LPNWKVPLALPADDAGYCNVKLVACPGATRAQANC